mgnify:CR=1 FL=1
MSDAIENLLHEERRFDPPGKFTAEANAQRGIHEEASADPMAFWAKESEKIEWRKPWDTLLDSSDAPFYRWFEGGRLNVTESCLDRHVKSHPDRVAFHWEGEPGDSISLTYSDLLAQVCQCAGALKQMGIGKGDTVAIYMGMVPEITVAMLACARIGAAHSVVFGGFSADSLRERLDDASCKGVITQDGSWRRGKVVPLKDNVDQALLNQETVDKTQPPDLAAEVALMCCRPTWQQLAVIDVALM